MNIQPRPIPIEPQAGQESVWSYPRPAIWEYTAKNLRVICEDIILAETTKGIRVLETSHPPMYYIPPEDIKLEYLVENPRKTWCEWKGWCRYFDVKIGDRYIPNAMWSYPEPNSTFAEIANYGSFYANLMDACYVDEQQVTPQAGDFYGGWITPDIVGPFKGELGTKWW